MHHRPVVVDETFHIALAVKYSVAMFWALASYFFGLRTLSLVAGDVLPWYESVWTLSVAAVSLALIGALLLKSERLEATFTAFWVLLVAVYPMCSTYLWATGDTDRAALAFFGLGFLVLPVWKFTFLIRKNRPNGR